MGTKKFSFHEKRFIFNNVDTPKGTSSSKENAAEKIRRAKEEKDQAKAQLETNLKAQREDASATVAELLTTLDKKTTLDFWKTNLDKVLNGKEIDGKIIDIKTLNSDQVNLMISVSNDDPTSREKTLKQIFDKIKKGEIEGTKLNSDSLIILMHHKEIGMNGIIEGTKGVGIATLSQKADLLQNPKISGKKEYTEPIYQEIFEHHEKEINNLTQFGLEGIVTYAIKTNDISKLEKSLNEDGCKKLPLEVQVALMRKTVAGEKDGKESTLFEELVLIIADREEDRKIILENPDLLSPKAYERFKTRLEAYDKEPMNWTLDIKDAEDLKPLVQYFLKSMEIKTEAGIKIIDGKDHVEIPLGTDDKKVLYIHPRRRDIYFGIKEKDGQTTERFHITNPTGQKIKDFIKEEFYESGGKRLPEDKILELKPEVVEKTTPEEVAAAKVEVAKLEEKAVELEEKGQTEKAKKITEKAREITEEAKQLIAKRNEVISKKVANVETIAVKIGTQIGREITIGELINGTYSYPVLIDKKETGYVLHVSPHRDRGATEYTVTSAILPKEGKTDWAKWQQEQENGTQTLLDSTLRDIAQKMPNRNPVQDREKAFATLESNGLTISAKSKEEMQPLTIDQFTALNDSAQMIENALQRGTDVYAVIQAFREARQIVYPRFANDVEMSFKPQGSRTEYPFKEWTKNESTLINKILEYKRRQFGENSEKYNEFFVKSQTRQTESEKEKRKSEKSSDRYIKNYERLTTMDFPIQGKIGSLDQSDMEKHWTQFFGHRSVDRIMTKHPFGLSENQVRKVATDIICGDNLFDRNDLVDFEDIFDYMKGFPAVDNKKVPAYLLKDGGDFLSKFNELSKKRNLTQEEETLRANMYKEIMVPCLELLEAMSAMKEPSGGLEKAMEETEKVTYAESIDMGLAPGQKQIVDSLKKLFFYTDSPTDAWKDFLNWASNGESEMTMSRMDGKSYAVDEGKFRRHYAPHSGLLALINKPGLYTTTDDGKKILNEQAVTQELNKIMQRGYQQKIIQRVIQLSNGKKPEEVSSNIFDQARTEIPADKYKITSLADIAKFNKDQLVTFQTGFINAKINQFEEKVQSIKDIYKDTPEALVTILKGLEDKVDKKQLAEIKSIMLGAAGINFHAKNGKYEATGAGIGSGIKLSDGTTFLWQVGANFEGNPPVLIGIGMSFNIGGNVYVAPNISVLGATVSLGGQHDIGSGVEFGWNFSLGMDWSQMSPGVGGGVGLSWDKAIIQAQKEDATKDAKEKSGLAPLWDDWDSQPRSQKWELIKKLPAFKSIEQEMQKNPDMLTEENVINMISSYKDTLQGEIYEQMNIVPFTPVGVKFGVANASLLATGPVGAAIALIGGIEFSLGSYTAFIPHPREEAKILKAISNTAIESKVREWLKNLKEGKETIELKELTPDLYYRPGKGLGTRIENHQIDLSGLETGIESYNEALKPAEVRLVKLDNGKVELVIDNDDDKDVEIHIDPLLHKLGAVLDRGRVYLEGDVDDLIITRERFEFPRAVAENNASLRDVITIRQKQSLTGGRDRQWMDEYESHFVEKVLGEKKYRLQAGANFEEGRQNFLEATGFVSNSMATALPSDISQKITEYQKFRSSFEGRINAPTLRAMEKDIEGMRKALGTKTKAEYEAERTPLSKLEPALNELYKDKEFKKAFTTRGVLDNPDRIITLIQKFAEKDKYKELRNLSDSDLNTAVTHLLNQWFVTLYRGSETADYSKEKLQYHNSIIRKRMERVKKWARGKYLSAFEKLKQEGKLSSSAKPKEMVNRMMDDIYKDILEKLKTPIHFGRDVTVGKGLEVGDILVSGTRSKKTNGATVRDFGRTLNYAETQKRENRAHEYGFLEGPKGIEIGKNYDPTMPGVEGDIARALLEIASPIEKDDLELIKSPLATKLLGLAAYRLIVEEPGGRGAKQYQEMMEIVQDPEKNISKYPEAIENFRNFVERIREAQLLGISFDIKTSHGITVRIDMSKTKIQSGAYSKCGNASHSVNELGEITILRPRKIKGILDVTNEIVDAELTKKMASFSLLGGFSSSSTSKPKTGKRAEAGIGEKDLGNKNASTGTSETINHGGQQIKINQPSGTTGGIAGR